MDVTSETIYTNNIRGLQSEVREIQLESIRTNPFQPRKKFLADELDQLADSVRQDGVIQPIVITQSEEKGKYTLIAGERRLRAAKKCGHTTIPAIIKQISAPNFLRIALIENIQRSDLSPIEEASAYSLLIEDHGLTQQQCAEIVSKKRSTVANFLRLLSLPKGIQDHIESGEISVGHAKALLKLNKAETALVACKLVIKKNLNVRQTEQLCTKLESDDHPKHPDNDFPEPDLIYLAENLRSHLRTKVKLVGKGERGKIEISYFSAGELERILELVGYKPS